LVISNKGNAVTSFDAEGGEASAKAVHAPLEFSVRDPSPSASFFGSEEIEGAVFGDARLENVNNGGEFGLKVHQGSLRLQQGGERLGLLL